MAQVLVRDISTEVVSRLKRRARENGRSLQAELKLTLERNAQMGHDEAWGLAARLRRRLGGRRHSDSVRLLARDRRR
jgi:plasmid stability protein